ncbi:unnamed protein product [Ectocarpus sp. CCAP 1310/34]|nr:unnamed protein product [Ectocarpus sp. CCAP 1310/34]
MPKSSKDSQPVVTKVLEPSEDLKNTHTCNEKKVSRARRGTPKNPCSTVCVPKN